MAIPTGMRPSIRTARTASPGLLVLLPLALAPACTDPDPPTPPDVTTGAYHGFVQRGWTLPHHATEARALGFDLDGDGDIDNQVGSLVGSLINLGLEIDDASADAFASGASVALHRVRADDLANDGTVEWRTYEGVPAGAPRFDGTDRFDVGAETGALTGMIHDGRAELTWGATTISLPFFPGQSPLRLPLVRAQLTADIDAAGCAGTIAGLIPRAELEGMILPNLAVEMIIHIARHPESEFTPIAMQVFDTNDDGQLTVAEVLATPLMRGLVSPDIDTDDDGVRDAMSFAAAFDCVPATFTPPEG